MNIKKILLRKYVDNTLSNTEQEELDKFIESVDNLNEFLDFITLKNKGYSAIDAYNEIFFSKKKLKTDLAYQKVEARNNEIILNQQDMHNPYFEGSIGFVFLHKFIDNLTILAPQYDQEISDLLTDNLFNKKIIIYRAVIKTLSDGFCEPNERYQKYHFDNNTDVINVIDKLINYCNISYGRIASIFNATSKEILNDLNI